MMTPLLEVKNLRASAGGKEILKGVGLAINSGEIHFIMGPNGSGKTTLAHALMGHPAVTVSGGVMEFRGEDMAVLPPEARARRGLYLGFQYPAEVPGVGTVSFLRTVLAARGESAPRTEEFRASLEPLAARMKMNSALLDRNLNEGFSGGEKKRSEILQLHVLNPVLAILDEFDSGLDVDGVRAVAASLNEWMNADRALVIITHTGRVAEYPKPDRVHVMKDGVVAVRGGAELASAIEEQGFEPLT